MSKVKITTDSASDLNDLFKTLDIDTLPLFVNLGEKEYTDGIDIDNEVIFDYVSKTNILPKTAARGIEEFKTFFSKYTDEGYAVVHIAISSKISSTFQNATLAARELKNVYVVDGLSLSSGTGLLAALAADLRDEGKSAEEIVNTLNETVPYVQASFVIDTMDYLYKGGRCNGLAMLAGSFLSIHPSILLLDGELKVRKKYMGKIRKCVNEYVSDILKKYNSPKMNRVFITHSLSTPEIIDSVKNQLINFGFDEKNIIITVASATITSHCGKGTLGILFINQEKITL